MYESGGDLALGTWAGLSLQTSLFYTKEVGFGPTPLPDDAPDLIA